MRSFIPRDEEMRILRGEQEVDEAALNFDDDEADDDELFSDEDAAVSEAWANSLAPDGLGPKSKRQERHVRVS